MTAEFNGLALRRKRKERGLTLVEVGRILGVSHQAVSQWERGETTPTIGQLPLLAATLHCQIDDLFTLPSVSAGT